MSKTNNYIVNYTDKTVVLNYSGEKFKFDLNEGDVGDFWHSLTTKEGIIKDINFSQDDEDESPSLSLYGVKEVDGKLLINTSDEIHIKKFKQEGNPMDYFG